MSPVFSLCSPDSINRLMLLILSTVQQGYRILKNLVCDLKGISLFADPFGGPSVGANDKGIPDAPIVQEQASEAELLDVACTFQRSMFASDDGGDGLGGGQGLSRILGRRRGGPLGRAVLVQSANEGEQRVDLGQRLALDFLFLCCFLIPGSRKKKARRRV